MNINVIKDKRGEANHKVVTVISLVVLAVVIVALFLMAESSLYQLTVFDPSLGSEDAPVLIEEYSDFECPACAQATISLKAVLEEYKDHVRFVFYDSPIPGHSSAPAAAVGALCAAQQDKFFEFHNDIFDKQSTWAGTSASTSIEELLLELVDEHELNKQDWLECIDSRNTLRAVEDDFEAGLERGVTSTPTFFVNGEKQEGALSLFQWSQVIDKILEEKGIEKMVDSEEVSESE